MNLLQIAARSEWLRRRLAELDARVLDALACLGKQGFSPELVAALLRRLRDRRRWLRIELDSLTEHAAELMGRPVARAPEAEPCPAALN